MNPMKSFLAESSGKFFRFVVTSKDLNLDKIKAIRNTTTQKPEEILGVTRKIDIHPKVHREPFRTMPTINQTNKKRSLLHLGRSMPIGI